MIPFKRLVHLLGKIGQIVRPHILDDPLFMIGEGKGLPKVTAGQCRFGFAQKFGAELVAHDRCCK